jgi:diguanylate cyclase (GGDEF)-like protein
VLLASGAPLGLLILQAWRDGAASLAWLASEWEQESPTYIYIWLSTLLVFAAFGYVLGLHADRLYELSSRDGLTGLRNRRVVAERLQEEVRRCLRYGAPLSVLLMDLDGLKARNDRHGHRAGDVALQAVATAIRGGARSTDVSGRWGGDEFVLLAPNTGAVEARQLAERIRAMAAAASDDGPVTISIGIATADGPRASAETLVRRADAALYEAKRLGRNRVEAA